MLEVMGDGANTVAGSPMLGLGAGALGLGFGRPSADHEMVLNYSLNSAPKEFSPHFPGNIEFPAE